MYGISPTCMDTQATLCIIAVASLFLWHFIRKRPGLPLPPGPKGYPIIGNLFDMPRKLAWLEYDRWFKIYGDMVYFKVFGQGFLILGSRAKTTDILERRSANYSDRPSMPMLLELMNWDSNFAFIPYGSWWRRHRRTFHQHFHSGAVHKYHSIQLAEGHAFLRRLLMKPENFMHHIRHLFAAVIMNVTYGIKVSDTDDPYITTAEEALHGLSQAGVPGRFLVDVLPILKYVPSWMPGAGFKREATKWRKLSTDMAFKPFKHVKETLLQGSAVPSVAAALIEALPDEDGIYRAEEERIARNIAAVAYAGGADTTVSAVHFFFLAMAMYPGVQRKAQAEIDSIVGLNRLPDYNDRDSLPYINALVKETMRWQSVAPLATSHVCSSDDEYNGYLIPKGTIVLGNAWTILHDPEVYPSPDEYKPERWLKDGKLDPDAQNPSVVAFGYGRRTCPGRYFSDESLYASISLVLSVYNIDPPVDDRGNVIPIQPEVTSGMLSGPKPFQCTIKPRSSAAEALIRGPGFE
ncbi:cytochrome P450 [Collybia nuda]|uniref:Cytochrome P450 n=1 Tax=Collybia nuda TaxID=64659 RepID=A0A9P5XZ51_9AGAR|nr:cytochrome P450 [Collybia nuda]